MPCLIMGYSVIWDSLTIGEYLAETFPDSFMWSRDKMSRAHARSICAEMHSVFLEVRSTFPQDLCRCNKTPRSSDIAALKLESEILPVQAIFSECLTISGE